MGWCRAGRDHTVQVQAPRGQHRGIRLRDFRPHFVTPRREGGRTTIAFDVRDDNSAVQKVEYSLDGDRWQALYPKDGIADSRAEQYEVTVTEAQGSAGVVLRAADALNNVASTRGVAPTGGR